jgi:hypothetical protein
VRPHIEPQGRRPRSEPQASEGGPPQDRRAKAGSCKARARSARAARRSRAKAGSCKARARSARAARRSRAKAGSCKTAERRRVARASPGPGPQGRRALGRGVRGPSQEWVVAAGWRPRESARHLPLRCSTCRQRRPPAWRS